MALVDNNVLSSLAKVDRLALIDGLFDEAATTPAVLDELQSDTVAGYDFVDRIDDVKHYNGGWLRIRSPTEAELKLTETIVDSSLSFTDAECLAIAETRGERLVTDDRHVGTIASQRGETDVWDLPVFIQACIVNGQINDEAGLDSLIEALREKDYYRFPDREQLYKRL